MVASKFVNIGIAVIERTKRTVITVIEVATKGGDLAVTSAAQAQKKIKEVSHTVKDSLDEAIKTLPIKELPRVPGNQSLYAVLEHLGRDELTNMYTVPLGMNDKAHKDMADNASDEGLRHHVAAALLSSAKNSLKLWQELPSYDEVVRRVAQKLEVCDSSLAEVVDVERAILFKIVDISISKMTPEETQKLTQQVEAELAARGVHRKVMLSEISDFTSFMAMDFAGAAGGLAGSTGLAGTVLGINALQLIVLKGIVATSGYVAAGGAWFGFGAGGAMMAIAGAAGPIALVLGTIYASYTLAGPAFRKLIPSICVIAAKRIEFLASQRI